MPNQDWKIEIRQAIKKSYAIVFCFSAGFANRVRSGMYPTFSIALTEYRELRQGSVFLIPIRLSECEIPQIEIDATRTLDRLQYVDLFPSSHREQAIKKLLKALEITPDKIANWE